MNVSDLRFFKHDKMQLAYREEGTGDPVLLIHGFSSSSFINWVSPGWFSTLVGTGYRVIAIDNRGHGDSDKSYDIHDYSLSLMAGDVVALLDHLKIAKAHIIGYSMGARIAAAIALTYASRVHSLIFGGVGLDLLTGVNDWHLISEALLSDNVARLNHPRSLMFRKFADQTKSNRQALAACVTVLKETLNVNQIHCITQPVLVAVGTKDDIAKNPQKLAAFLPHGQAFNIPDRDHMLAVGDKIFKQRVLEFLASNSISQSVCQS